MYPPHSMHVSMQLLAIRARDMESFTFVELRVCVKTTLINVIYMDIEAMQCFIVKRLTPEVVKNSLLPSSKHTASTFETPTVNAVLVAMYYPL